jgi:hypothetical protein
VRTVRIKDRRTGANRRRPVGWGSNESRGSLITTAKDVLAMVVVSQGAIFKILELSHSWLYSKVLARRDTFVGCIESRDLANSLGNKYSSFFVPKSMKTLGVTVSKSMESAKSYMQ